MFNTSIVSERVDKRCYSTDVKLLITFASTEDGCQVISTDAHKFKTLKLREVKYQPSVI